MVDGGGVKVVSWVFGGVLLPSKKEKKKKK